MISRVFMAPKHDKELSMNLSKINFGIKEAYEVGYKCTKDGGIISNKGRTLKLNVTNNTSKAYYTFTYKFKNGRYGKRARATIPVHRFIGYVKYGEQLFTPGLVIRHLDSNSKNNTFENLQLGTYSSNSMDIPPEIRISRTLKGAAKTRKLTDLQVIEIEEKLLQGKSHSQLAAEYGCSRFTIYYNTRYKYIRKTSITGRVCVT